MQNTKELILAKLNEIADLLVNATCEGITLEHKDCEDVNNEIYGAMGKLEQAVDYYLD